MTNRVPLSPLVLALLTTQLCFPAPVFADDDNDDGAEHLLITGTRAASSWHRQTNAMSWLSRDALNAKKPQNMGDALNAMAGVYWVDLGNEQHAMAIRQPLSYSAAYLYLEDGLPIRPLGLFNHNALNEVNLAGAGQIEALKGPASSLYGSNAVGGALNFLTADARENQGQFQVRGSDQGYRRVDVNAERVWQDGGLRIALYSAQLRDGWQQHSDMDKSTTTLRLDQQLGDRTAFWFTATHSDLQTDMPGGLDTDDYQRTPEKSYNSFTWRSDVASRVAGFLNHELDAHNSLQVALFARDNSHAQLPSYLIFNNPKNPAVASGRENDNRFTSKGLDAWWQHTFAAMELEFVAGLYLDRSPNTYEEKNLDITREPATGRYPSYRVTTLRRDYAVDIRNDAFYTQWQGQLGKRWLWQAGARHDRIDYAFDNHLIPNGSTGPADESRGFSHTSPRAGLVVLLDSSQSLFASIAQGFIPPEVSSLYGRLDVPSLRESVFNSAEFGWRIQKENLRADITAYRMEGDDELVSYTIAQGLSEPRNAGATRHQGVEFGLDWQFASAWKLEGALAWSEHVYQQFRVSPTLAYDGKDIKGSPAWLGQISLQWVPQEHLRLRLTQVHVADYFMDDDNTRRYGGHDLLQFAGDWQFKQLRLSLNIHNLGDVRYADTASWASGRASYTPGAPRTISTTASWTF